MTISKSSLSIAGEYAVACELCRRNIYAQLTLGNLKRTDLLVSLETGGMARIEVKAKQGPEWPNCLGIAYPDEFLVFVDFQSKGDVQRPDFYILALADWRLHLELVIKEYKQKHPNRRTQIDDNNALVLLDEVNRYGKPYRGCGVHPNQIGQHRDAWHKILKYLEANKRE